MTHAVRDSETLLNPESAAKRLDVTAETLAVWRCKRRYPLKFIKIGRSVKYRESDILEFIASRTHSGVGDETKRTRRRTKKL